MPGPLGRLREKRNIYSSARKWVSSSKPMKSKACPWYFMRSAGCCREPKRIFAPLGKRQVWLAALKRAPGKAAG